MTKVEIEAVFERVRTWPEDRQEQAIELLLEFEAFAADVYRLSEEERRDIRDGIAEADRGEFASDDEMAAILSRAR